MGGLTQREQSKQCCGKVVNQEGFDVRLAMLNSVSARLKADDQEKTMTSRRGKHGLGQAEVG